MVFHILPICFASETVILDYDASLLTEDIDLAKHFYSLNATVKTLDVAVEG
jgi:hypothetical protein